MLSDHNGIKSGINNNKLSRKTPNIWKLNTLLNNPTVIKTIVRNYYEPLYANKFNNLHETNKFLEN